MSNLDDKIPTDRQTDRRTEGWTDRWTESETYMLPLGGIIRSNKTGTEKNSNLEFPGAVRLCMIYQISGDGVMRLEMICLLEVNLSTERLFPKQCWKVRTINNTARLLLEDK